MRSATGVGQSRDVEGPAANTSSTPAFRERRAWGAGQLHELPHTSSLPQQSAGAMPQPVQVHASMPGDHGLEPSPKGRGTGGGGALGGGSGARSVGARVATSALSSPLAAEVIYCTVSAGTTLFNKATLSSFDFPAPNVLLLFQFVLAVALLQALHLARLVQLQPVRWETVRVWVPVNLIFVAMNATGFYALQDIGAGALAPVCGGVLATQYAAQVSYQFATISACCAVPSLLSQACSPFSRTSAI